MPVSSGPLLDRIDIHIEVPRVEYEKLSDDRPGEPSAAIQVRVEAARQRQRERFSVGAVGAKQFHSNDGPHLNGASPQTMIHSTSQSNNDASFVQSNADMRPAEVRQYCTLDDTCRSLMRTAMSQLQLSARAYHRILKLARTIADLAGSENIGPSHLAEALQYRPRVMVG
jgi:magnesium chelatase family protein